MTATTMDGRSLAERVRAEVKEDLGDLGEVGLATVLLGEDSASHVYIRIKQRTAKEVGIRAVDRRLPEDTAEDALVELVAELNDDDSIDGILVQTPLPAHIDESRVMRTIDPMKDVDGLHPFNAGQLLLGHQTLVGATPLGIMRLLEEYEIPLAHKRAVVVGRSLIVGRPVALLLLHANATVTICHSRTDDLGHHTREADILVVAVGTRDVVTPDMVKPGAAVIDVGMNRVDGRLVGDVDPLVAAVAGFLTPVPGGVGPMTIAYVLANAVRAARYRRGALAFPRV